MDYLHLSSILTPEQYYYYQLSNLYNQQFQGMNYQTHARNLNYIPNHLYQAYIQQQQQQQLNQFDPLQQLLSYLNQTNQYQQIPQSIHQINIGNTIHQVNYNINRDTEPQVITTKSQEIDQNIEDKIERLNPINSDKKPANMKIEVKPFPKIIINTSINNIFILYRK